MSDRQKAARARETYLAYQQEGRALDARRLAQLSGYSPRNARRKLQDLATTHGPFQATETGDDTTFAHTVLEQLDTAHASDSPPAIPADRREHTSK